MIRIRVDLGMLDRYPSDRLPDLAGRGRIGRRLAAVGHRPDCLGIGIEEYTAFRCEGCNARAIGSGGVMIVDASWASHSNAADAGPGDILSLHAATLHAFGNGDCFGRAARRPARWAVPKAQHAALRPEKGQRQSGPTALPEYCRASDTSP